MKPDDKNKDKDKLKKIDSTEDDSDQGESGSGAAGSSIQFADFVTGKTGLTEDSLPPDEIRRLRAVHNTAHEDRVKKQKALIENRNAVKEGKDVSDRHQAQMAAERENQYPPHPLLADKAQFSGIDKQENQVPSLNETQTNEGDKEKLENKYRKQHQPEMGKKFIPPTPLPR